jgi:uncharacterized protein
MKYVDRVYGEVEITEPVILDLINSSTLQRLKGIDQAGYRPLWVKPNVEIGEYDNTRFSHSLGVYILLNKYNTPIEEQIAGLIHDVSHLTFSHCIDYVLNSGSEKNQNHQDSIYDNFVRKSEIPEILKKYGFDLEYILDDHNFPLKENNQPDICADRIDYSLRTAVIFEEILPQDKNLILDNLKVKDNKWIFEDFETAKNFAELFLKLNTIYYASFVSAVMYRLLGVCLRYALEMEYITESDFYETDKDVIDKIKMYLDDEKLKTLFERMDGRVKAVNDSDNYQTSVFCKSRIIDPWFKGEDGVKKVSEADPSWAETVKRELIPKQYFIRFLN